MSEVLVRNNNSYLEAVPCEDGETYFVQPRSVATISSKPVSPLPEGIIIVKQPTDVKTK